MLAVLSRKMDQMLSPTGARYLSSTVAANPLKTSYTKRNGRNTKKSFLENSNFTVLSRERSLNLTEGKFMFKTLFGMIESISRTPFSMVKVMYISVGRPRI